MTLNELTNMMWYVADIIVIEKEPKSVLNYTANIEEIRRQAIFDGTNAMLRSDVYKDLRSRQIMSFGAIGDYIIITLK